MDIATLGEFGLIARLTRELTTHVGDDCAILDLHSDGLLLLTCDSQVEGVHFTLQTSSPEHIGCKALAINLSDIAAMGGEPRYALISLILPTQLPLAVIEGIYAGLRQEAAAYATMIVGGNIASAGTAEQLIIDITLLGTVERGHALTRDGAHVGDSVCVTGALGDSAAGLYTLLYPDQRYPQNAQESLCTRHRTPQPRVREGRILSHLRSGVVTAMLDLSDGLSGDLGHLCERSKVGARIEVAHVPLSQDMRAIAVIAGRDPLLWALHGGEDYELLFTVSPGNERVVIDAVQSATGTPVTAIGKICAPDEGMKVVYPDGCESVLEVLSWDHLRSAS